MNQIALKSVRKGLEIKSVEFLPDKIRCYLIVPYYLTKTSQIPSLRRNLVGRFPGLKYHRCDNEKRRSFLDELNDTELAHAFEHLLIEIISQRDRKVDRVKGWTNWDWQKNPRWSYQIELEYADKEIFFFALIDALKVISELSDIF